MALFNFLKPKKEEALEEGLTKEEEKIAFQIAEVAATLMQSQFETAALLAGPERKDEVIEASFAFAFGVLVGALEGKGISWEKSPYVGIYFVESWMQDSTNSKETAQVLFHNGMQEQYLKYRDAGVQAFDNFINCEDDDSYRAKDFARSLGLSE